MIELIPIIVRQQQLRLPRIVCIYNRERVMVGGAHTLCAIGCPRVAYGLIILHVRHSPLTFRIPLRTRNFPGMYLVMARHARGAPPASSPPPQYSCQYLWQCCAPICAHVPFTSLFKPYVALVGLLGARKAPPIVSVAYTVLKRPNRSPGYCFKLPHGGVEALQ